MKEILGLAAIILGLIAYVPYLIDIFKRKVEPHPFSWLIWGLGSSLIFALQISHGGGAGAWVTATVALMCFMVSALAFYFNGSKNITKNDILSLSISIVALCLWLWVDLPTVAALSMVVAEVFGLIPTLRKTWVNPYSESYPVWIINSLRHALSLGALGALNLITVSNPVFWTVSNLTVAVIIFFRRLHLK